MMSPLQGSSVQFTEPEEHDPVRSLEDLSEEDYDSRLGSSGSDEEGGVSQKLSEQMR